MNAPSHLWLPEFTRSAAELLSVVVPVYNEREVLPLFCERLQQALGRLQMQHEILFVDDGSKDGSADFLRLFALSVPTVKVIALSRNFGKEAAGTDSRHGGRLEEGRRCCLYATAFPGR